MCEEGYAWPGSMVVASVDADSGNVELRASGTIDEAADTADALADAMVLEGAPPVGDDDRPPLPSDDVAPDDDDLPF